MEHENLAEKGRREREQKRARERERGQGCRGVGGGRWYLHATKEDLANKQLLCHSARTQFASFRDIFVQEILS